MNQKKTVKEERKGQFYIKWKDKFLWLESEEGINFNRSVDIA